MKGILIVNKYRMSESTAQNVAFLNAQATPFRHAIEQAVLNCGKPHVFKQNGVWLQLRITR